MYGKKDLLQLSTYMCPSISVSYYEFIASYLESKLGLRTTLLYDSRKPGPDISCRDQNFIDIAFVSTPHFIENLTMHNAEFKLLPVGAVSLHPVKGETLGYFTDIVLHNDANLRVKEFLDLRGCSFAYSHETSISSSKQVLINLKQFGENASFFSNVIAGGNHIAAIDLLLARKADCAALCSLSLDQFMKEHYYLSKEINIFESWGPLPPHPIIVNKNLPSDLTADIAAALLQMHKNPEIEKQLNKFGVVRFDRISTDTYLDAEEMLTSTKSLSIGVTYY